MEVETIIYNLILSAAEMKRRTPYSIARRVPKVLIGKRSAMLGSDEKNSLGEERLLREPCKPEEGIITFS